jgi:hypothetical protein
LEVFAHLSGVSDAVALLKHCRNTGTVDGAVAAIRTAIIPAASAALDAERHKSMVQAAVTTDGTTCWRA